MLSTETGLHYTTVENPTSEYDRADDLSGSAVFRRRPERGGIGIGL